MRKSILRIKMKEQRIVRYKKGMKDLTDWDRVRATTDDEIDYSNAPPVGPEFFANARPYWPTHKVSLGVRFDNDIVNWFKRQGPGYQTRMNAVLRIYMEGQKMAAMEQQQHKRKRRKTPVSGT
jgi:uncharacterized protein (DUF4415 family)